MENLFGRQVIYADTDEVTDSNVAEIVTNALHTHLFNRHQIDYLHNYYKGNQDILNRTKDVRPEICNKIVENRAHEIVTFGTSYQIGNPLQYVGRNSEDYVTRGVTELNDMMNAEDKQNGDKELVDWQMICGTAYRMVLPDKTYNGGDDESPFELYTLDPKDTFVVYSSHLHKKPLIGVSYYTNSEGMNVYSIYSPTNYWEVEGNVLGEAKILDSKPHSLGMIPIIEYPANADRLGSFEIVIPLLNEINNIASNRMDGIEQFIQAFLKFKNCKIDKETYDEMKKLGAIAIESKGNWDADVELVSEELDQSQTQVTKADAYQSVLTICGMPNRNGGTSTSDTGAAVVMRDGWSLAESRAKDREVVFNSSEKKMLKLVLRICRDKASVPEDVKKLTLKDIEIKPDRRNYEAMLAKAQVLCMMLDNPKIAPIQAYIASNMFLDPESACAQGMEYFETHKTTEKSLNASDREVDKTQEINNEQS